jgi:WD40 repeat protein
MIFYSYSMGWSQSRLVLPVMHNGTIVAFDECPERSLLATGDDEGVIKIWEANDGKQIYTVVLEDDQIVALKFFHQGQFFISFGGEGSVKIWESSTGNEVKSIQLPQKIQGAWQISSQQWVVFSESVAGCIQLGIGNEIQWVQTIPGNWSSFNGEERKNCYASAIGPLHVVNEMVLTMNSNRSKLFLKRWSVGDVVKKWQWNDETIQTAEFTPDGKYIFVGMVENRWRVIEAESGKEIYENKNFEGAVLDFAFHPIQKRVMVTSDDHVCREFNMETGDLIFSRKMDDPINGTIGAYYTDLGNDKIITDFTQDCEIIDTENSTLKYHYHEEFEGHHMLVSSLDEKFIYFFHRRFWRKVDLQKGREVFVHAFSPFSFLNKFEGQKDWIISSSYGRVFVIDSRTGKNVFEGKNKSRALNNAIMHEKSEILILGGEEKIYAWKYKEQDSLEVKIKDRAGSISCLKWSEDSLSFYASAEDRKIVEYSSRDFSVLREIKFQSVGSAIMSFDLDFIRDEMIVAGEDSCLHFYDLKSGELLRKWNTTAPVLWKVQLNHARNELLVSGPPRYPGAKGLTVLYEYPSMKVKFDWSSQDLTLVADISKDDRYFITPRGNEIWMMDTRTGEVIRKFESHKGWITACNFSDDDSKIVSNSSDTQIIVWDVASVQPKYHRINLLHVGFGLTPMFGQYLLYDDFGRFEGTEKGRDKIYLSCGLEIIELAQLKDALYVPGLVEKIMSGQPIQYPKLSDLEICGTLPLIEKVKDSLYHYTITPRKLGLKRVELYINGKRVMSKKREELKKVEEHYEWNIEEKEIEKFFVPGEENEVKVIGIVQQGNNEMQSRGVVEEVDIPETKNEHPNFYGLMVGVSDYKDDRLDLKYPTKDSKDVGKVMEAAAKKLLNTSTENHVKMYYVNSEVKGENGFTTPERAGVKMALESIAKEAKAEDVVMIFFAGHGVMEGDKDKRFTFLTAESTKENLVGISTKDLEQWMSGENGYLPNKTILIFDACNSGQATEELMAMARDDDETQRIRQVEDLKDKSGMFIMSASAANQSAYELPRYGHGLLTYSLLKTLKTSSSTLDEEKFINVQKWFLETETTMDNMTRELGIEQEAQPFGRGNIRVGELDEEIRGDIEIQQEKPMVFCANALNLDTDDDDLLLKQLFNDYLKNYQTRGEAKVALATQEKGSIKVNFKYSLGSDGQLQGLASIFINGNKEQISWKGKPSDLELFFKQVLWVVE